MHVNVYSEDLESGIESITSGTKNTKEGDFHFIQVEFKTGNAVSFFSSDERNLEELTDKLTKAFNTLFIMLHPLSKAAQQAKEYRERGLPKVH